MRHAQRRRFHLEAVLAGCSALCLAVTLFWPDWIEAVLGYDPDRHGGAVERVLVTGLLVATVALGLAARWKRRRMRAEAAEPETERA